MAIYYYGLQPLWKTELSLDFIRNFKYFASQINSIPIQWTVNHGVGGQDQHQKNPQTRQSGILKLSDRYIIGSSQRKHRLFFYLSPSYHRKRILLSQIFAMTYGFKTMHVSHITFLTMSVNILSCTNLVFPPTYKQMQLFLFFFKEAWLVFRGFHK